VVLQTFELGVQLLEPLRGVVQKVVVNHEVRMSRHV
jgi:hypothetical protein